MYARRLSPEGMCGGFTKALQSRALPSLQQRAPCCNDCNDFPQVSALGSADILSDYLPLGGFADEEFASQWQVLEGMLRQAERKLTRGDIRSRWPSAERPDRATLYRWLRRAVERGLLRQDGLGKCQHPFRYWLVANEERWRKDPLALIHMPELFRPSPL